LPEVSGIREAERQRKGFFAAAARGRGRKSVEERGNNHFLTPSGAAGSAQTVDLGDFRASG
jgi:hypothetical protein